LNEEERLWRDEPPEASAVEWARAYETVQAFSNSLYDDDVKLIAGNELKNFILEDTLQRCWTEAERREPGIIGKRLQHSLENLRAHLEEFAD
jgi:hypothetical protein